METSQNHNSLPGTNGPEETQEKQPVLLNKPSRRRPKSEKQAPVSESEPEVAVVADASGSNAGSETLSPADVKLAIRMNRHIMSVLGLNKRSRSFKV